MSLFFVNSLRFNVIEIRCDISNEKVDDNGGAYIGPTL